MAWHAVDVSPNSSSTSVRVDGKDVLVVKLDEGWGAIENRCSHADCSFVSDGEIDGTTVICNCHGSEFDVRTGEVLMPPAIDPIMTFPVRIRAGRLEVAL